MAQYRNKKTIAWIALVVAVAALIMSWLAFDRASTQDVEDLIDQRVDEAIVELEAELETLQADPETDETSEEVKNTGTTTTDFSTN